MKIGWAVCRAGETPARKLAGTPALWSGVYLMTVAELLVVS
jgi:hypothetical protein